MNPKEIQSRLFQLIKANHPPQYSLADELADILQIGMDSSYRRIRGEKLLDIGEMALLCSHFNISLDSLVNLKNSGSVIFNLDLNPENTLDGYLHTLSNHVKRAADFPGNKMVYYDTKDFAPFRHFEYFELARFKYLFWIKTILANSDYKNTSFESFELPDSVFEEGKKVIAAYNRIPSTELWSPTNLDITFSQIDYFMESGYFTKESSVSKLYEELIFMIRQVKEQADSGFKTADGDSSGQFHLFVNETYLGNNTVLFEQDENKLTYINYDVLNYMSTNDTQFFNRCKTFIQKTLVKSTLVSKVNDKERNRFFNLLEQKVRSRMKNIAV